MCLTVVDEQFHVSIDVRAKKFLELIVIGVQPNAIDANDEIETRF